MDEGVPPRQQLPEGQSRNVPPAREGSLPLPSSCRTWSALLTIPADFPFLPLTRVFIVLFFNHGYSVPTSAFMLHVTAGNFFFFF